MSKRHTIFSNSRCKYSDFIQIIKNFIKKNRIQHIKCFFNINFLDLNQPLSAAHPAVSHQEQTVRPT